MEQVNTVELVTSEAVTHVEAVNSLLFLTMKEMVASDQDQLVIAPKDTHQMGIHAFNVH